jgi:dipeptidyl aminopeptidase/acylaminoacyl peptidase
MLVWVILPPNFDATKKYPTLLYCQGGPQSALTILFFPLEFSVNGCQWLYCCSTKSSRNARTWVEWNEQISKDWGGQVMDDYLSAIDDISKESYVDNAL